jgi:hypothetical protein
VLILLVMGTLVYALASMRQLYVQMLRNESGSLQQQVESILQNNATGAVREVAATRLGLAGYTLMALNLTLFVVGAAASFLRHDPHPDYESAWRAERRARARLTRIRARFEARLHAARRQHDGDVNALDQMLRETEARHDQLAGELAGITPFFGDTVARIANGVRSRSLAFVEGALAALPEGAEGGSLQDIQASSEQAILRVLLGDGQDA